MLGMLCFCYVVDGGSSILLSRLLSCLVGVFFISLLARKSLACTV